MSEIIGYVAPLKDYSGYGEAARNDVAALLAAGYLVHADCLRYVNDVVNLGHHTKNIEHAITTPAMYDIKILHTTPDQFHRYIELGKYHIGRLFWETTHLPKDFVDGLNLCNEIWTGSEANRTAAVKSGVTKPIYLIPQAINTQIERPKPFEIDGFDGYLFYNVFEWIDRKNPELLIAAYLEAFQNGENVGLLLKTYFKDFTFTNKQYVRERIIEYKSKYGSKHDPPIFFYGDLLDKYSMWRMHATGDCLVSPHRGEGWGVPQVEAALMGNNIISTKYGGVHEWLPDDCAELLPYNFIPVSGMEHSQKWYTPDQQWADVDGTKLVAALQRQYEKREQNGKKLQEYIKDTFSYENVGRLMENRLKQLTT